MLFKARRANLKRSACSVGTKLHKSRTQRSQIGCIPSMVVLENDPNLAQSGPKSDFVSQVQNFRLVETTVF